MNLSYVIKNNTSGDFPLQPGEAWKFIVHVDDVDEARDQMEKVKMSAAGHAHDIMNVYLDDRPFDARAHATDGANEDDFPYDDTLVIHKVNDETKLRRQG